VLSYSPAPPNGSGQYILSDEERARLDQHVADWLRSNSDYVERQRRWFGEEPWKAVVGMTPTEAVKKLEELGW